MEPTIKGRGASPLKPGNLVLVLLITGSEDIRPNDLVVVTEMVGGMPVRTVRRVLGVPGDEYPDPRQAGKPAKL